MRAGCAALILLLACASALSVPGSGNLAASAVTLLAPNGGEQIVTGSEFTIRWTTTGDSSGSVSLSYSTDGGQSWVDIAALPHISGEQNYAWTVPDDTTVHGRVRVVWMRMTAAASDMSDADFTISRPAPPAKPLDLTAAAASTSSIELNWIDVSTTETGFSIERRTADLAWAVIDIVAANVTEYTDSGLLPDTTYQYRVQAYSGLAGFSPYSNLASATTDAPEQEPEQPAEPEPAETVVIRLSIDQTAYLVNGELKTMDAAPIIRHGRTLLPIRYVAENIGAAVSWDPYERKAMVVLGERTVELWLNQNQARVNGTMVPLDSNNTSVTPISVPPGRTMLPLRFVAEALGCEVGWDPQIREVTVVWYEMPPHPLGREI